MPNIRLSPAVWVCNLVLVRLSRCEIKSPPSSTKCTQSVNIYVSTMNVVVQNCRTANIHWVWDDFEQNHLFSSLARHDLWCSLLVALLYSPRAYPVAGNSSFSRIIPPKNPHTGCISLSVYIYTLSLFWLFAFAHKFHRTEFIYINTIYIYSQNQSGTWIIKMNCSHYFLDQKHCVMS